MDIRTGYFTYFTKNYRQRHYVIICCQSESLQREILDLQSEFEFDRIDYLDTIRKQEQEQQYLQAVIDRLLPVIRRDCNYVNLDRIRAQSMWDENNQAWILPKLTIEKTQLPPAGNWRPHHSLTSRDSALSPVATDIETVGPVVEDMILPRFCHIVASKFYLVFFSGSYFRKSIGPHMCK